MKRGTYSLLWRLAMPLVLGRLWWRGMREPGYRKHWNERLGKYGPRGAGWHTLWIHAVSVGETRAAEPLVNALMAQYPHSRILMTHMTPTGRATGQALYAHHGERFVQSYLPYDMVNKLTRFMRHFTPRICILMETEVWPNLITVCKARGILHQAAEAPAAPQRAFRQARVDQRHRHPAGAGGDQVGPDFGLHQDADARLEVAQEAPDHEDGVVRQVGLHQALAMLAEQRGPGGAAGRSHVGKHDAAVGPGLHQGVDQRFGRARLAHRHGMHPDAVARRRPLAVKAQALGPVLAVARFLEAAPPQPAQHQRQGQPPQDGIQQAHQAASSSVRAAAMTSSAEGGAPCSPRLTMRGDQLPSVFHLGESA